MDRVILLGALMALAMGCGDEQAGVASTDPMDVATGLDADSPEDTAEVVLDASGGDAPTADSGPEEDASAADADGVAPSDAGPDVGPVHLCPSVRLEPWSRGQRTVGGTVAFSELMYHPPGDQGLEWLEIHNPMTVDMDLSGWRLEGGVDFTFAEGTFLPGGGYLVVAADPAQLAAATGVFGAFGPYGGALSNGGEEILLRSNGGRLMDAVAYDDDAPWPVAPDGTGASLAKRGPLAASPRAESWTASPRSGGTPGLPNFPPPPPPEVHALVALDASWRWEASGAEPPADWSAPGFDDAGWSAGPGGFYAGEAVAPSATATALITADNHFAWYLGGADGSGLRLVGRDAVGDWQSAETFEALALAGEHVYLAAWEAPGDSGSPQMVIAEVALPDGTSLATDKTTFEVVLGPPDANPGGALADPPPAVEQLASLVAAADLSGSWAAPQVQRAKDQAPWGGVLAGAFGSAACLWLDTFDGASATNTQETYALFRSVEPLAPAAVRTELPLGATTSYFRVAFDFAGDPASTELMLDALVDDGAVFYLNGVEVHRHNLPPGSVTASTLAIEPVEAPAFVYGIELAAAPLVQGVNVLAVEVHQAAADDADMAFEAALFGRVWPPAPEEPGAELRFHEVAAGGAGPLWVELVNAGDAARSTGGLVIRSSSGEEHALAPEQLEPGELLLLAQDQLGFGAEPRDVLSLVAPGTSAILDAVRVTDTVLARAPSASRWLNADLATPGAANAPLLHHEIVINELMYHHPPIDQPDGSVASSPEEWIELYNRGDAPVDLSGWQLVDGLRFELPAGTLLEPDGYLVVARDAAALQEAVPSATVVGDFAGRLDNGGETVELRDACGNPVDRVRYYDGGDWPEWADGGGSSLERRSPWAPSDSAQTWAASDEAGGAAWQSYSYRGTAAPSAVGPDGRWHELVIGLLDEGVALIDDLSVVRDPDGAGEELVQDGTFDSEAAVGWRLLGNHRHSEVVPDPTDPSNPVLRLEATGPAGHMHNHAETTLAGGALVEDGVDYRISFRARWVAGSNQLSTRLYFNRLARTTRLPLPERHGTPGGPNSTSVANLGPACSDLAHSPAVPAAGEPVSVQARVRDPDGVASVMLHWAVDDGPFVALEMVDMGDGRFVAEVPGQPASAVAQIYLEAVDGLGAASACPSRGADSRALWQVAAAPPGGGALRPLRIILTPADAEWLHRDVNLMSDDHVGATVIYDQREVFYDVGVRLKGSERGRPRAERLGFGLYFSAQQPFRGVYRSVLVDRSEGVGYGQREMLINQMMTHAGSVSGEYNDLVQLLAPRAEHTGPAELQLARFGDLLLDNQFDDGGAGALFEYELVYYPTTTDDGTPEGLKLPQPDGVVGTAIRDLGDDPEAYRHTFLVKNNRRADDYRRVMALAAVFGLSGDDFVAQVGEVIDVDEWLRAFAFATLSGTVDQYGNGAQHNAQLYVRPSDQRVLYFPHDLDFFSGSPGGPVVANGDLAKLLGNPVWARRFYGQLHEIIETTCNDGYMSYWREHFGRLLPGQDFEAHHAFLVQRAAHVLSGAADSVTRAIPPVAFAITSEDGADFAVSAATATLAGVGWVDLREIWRVGSAAPLAVSWTAATAWQAEVDLVCGPNTVTLQARDYAGRPLGSDVVVITRSGGGCP